MPNEVITRKLKLLIKYIEDLKKYKDISYEEFLMDHYAVERILELLIITSVDIVFHLLSEKEEPIPSSLRSAFLRAGELGMIKEDLAKSLSKAAGMRNILVHEYEEIDYKIIYRSINQAIRDFSRFLVDVEKFINPE